jgi:hypothetical protein
MTAEVPTGKRSVRVDVWVFDGDSQVNLKVHDEQEITLSADELVDSDELTTFIDETVPALIRRVIRKALA